MEQRHGHSTQPAPERHVLVVDDQRAFHVLFTHIVRKAMGPVSVHFATTLDAGLSAAAKFSGIELLLLSASLPRCTALQALFKFHDALPEVPILVVSGSENRDVIETALKSGAHGYLPKSDDHEALGRAVNAVAHGGRYIPAQLLGENAPLPKALTNPSPRGERRESLTPRQSEVLRLKIRGRTARDIGLQLGISESTVKQHLNATYRVLGVVSQLEARAAVVARDISLD